VIERRHTKRSRRTSSKSGPAGNKWYQLIAGLLVAVTGSEENVKKLNTCLPKSWAIADTADPKTDKEEEKTTATKVLDVLSEVIKFVCKFKDNIKKLFDKKMKLYNKKLFLLKMERYKKNGWSIGGLIKSAGDKVSSAVSKTANFVGNAVDKGINAVAGGLKQLADWAKKGWNELTELAGAAVKKITEMYVWIKTKIEAILNNELVKNILQIVECAKEAKEAMKAVYDVIKGIYDKVTTIVSGGFIGLGKVFVDLICNFDIFRQSVNALIKGVGEKDILKKYNNYGQFIGFLIKALGSKRLRLMKLYLL
jgi:hypothetical protein